MNNKLWEEYAKGFYDARSWLLYMIERTDNLDLDKLIVIINEMELSDNGTND